jgi:uncharacterized protein YbgA (DUF1722 family)
MKDNQIEFFNQRYRITEKDVREFVLERFEDVKHSNKIENLVKFQAYNKYMIMAHDQLELKSLGNIVAKYKKISFSEILQEYQDHLKTTLIKEPTTKTHTNVIMHIFGYFSKNLNHQEKQVFFELLEKFRENKITVGKMLSEINPMIFRFDNTYLASQTYFLLYSDVQHRVLFQKSNRKNEDEFSFQ